MSPQKSSAQKANMYTRNDSLNNIFRITSLFYKHKKIFDFQKHLKVQDPQKPAILIWPLEVWLTSLSQQNRTKRRSIRHEGQLQEMFRQTSPFFNHVYKILSRTLQDKTESHETDWGSWREFEWHLGIFVIGLLLVKVLSVFPLHFTYIKRSNLINTGSWETLERLCNLEFMQPLRW